MYFVLVDFIVNIIPTKDLFTAELYKEMRSISSVNPRIVCDRVMLVPFYFTKSCS